MSNNTAAKSSENALMIKKQAVTTAEGLVQGFMDKGRLNLPPDYSLGNAIRQAWLTIQETKDKDNRPAIEVCTTESITNAVLSMAVQGLSPGKNQCYFIVYGTKLTMQRSYFGMMSVAKRVDPNIEDIFPDVVYADDEFEYEKIRGRTIITKHRQKLANIDKAKIAAAYCTVIYKDDKEVSTIMTLDEIKEAWKMSQMKPIDEKGNIKAGSTHGKFTGEMCKKSVVYRACKPIINGSDDSTLLAQYAKMSDQDAAYAETQEDIEENANKGNIIDIDDYTTVDADTGEVLDEIPKNEDTDYEQEQPANEQQAAFADADPGFM